MTTPTQLAYGVAAACFAVALQKSSETLQCVRFLSGGSVLCRIGLRLWSLLLGLASELDLSRSQRFCSPFQFTSRRLSCWWFSARTVHRHDHSDVVIATANGAAIRRGQQMKTSNQWMKPTAHFVRVYALR